MGYRSAPQEFVMGPRLKRLLLESSTSDISQECKKCERNEPCLLRPQPKNALISLLPIFLCLWQVTSPSLILMGVGWGRRLSPLQWEVLPTLRTKGGDVDAGRT